MQTLILANKRQQNLQLPSIQTQFLHPGVFFVLAAVCARLIQLCGPLTCSLSEDPLRSETGCFSRPSSTTPSQTGSTFSTASPEMSGDHIRVYSFSRIRCSIEVGVRAEAYQDQGTNRHINSAFMIFEVLDDHGKPCTLPGLRPEPLVSWPRRPDP